MPRKRTSFAPPRKPINPSKDHAYDLEDGEGGKAQLVLWNSAGEDLWGAIARSERVVNAMEGLLGDEVYHYHSKMSIKQPRTGGAWSWHQDYGYWYQNGCLFPDMGSAFIAVDPNTRANGRLQVLKGSHKMGRIEHGRYGDQTGADPERTDEATRVMELVYVELDPGDTLFFHSNLLHRSDQNTSPDPRWSLICCYNTKHNDPYKDSHHPRYAPLEKLPDTAIKEMGAKLFESKTDFESRRRCYHRRGRKSLHMNLNIHSLSLSARTGASAASAVASS